jgi:hypothetical protein
VPTKFESRLDRRIFKTIQGSSAANPQTLVGIIAGVDASERLVLTYEELSGGLQRLIDAGHIAETEPGKFCDASSGEYPRSSSGITESDYGAAVEEYRHWFQRKLDELDNEPGPDDFVWRKLVLRWATPNDRWPTDDDEDGAAGLATSIDPIIAQSGLGEINGFEYGSGHIDVLVFGKATDSDVDRIYELLAPPFRSFGCPAGSRIIRFYRERDEKIESDVVSHEGE